MSLYRFYIDDSKPLNYEFWGGFIVEASKEKELLQKFYELKSQSGLDRLDPIKFSPNQNKERYKKQTETMDQNVFREKVIKFISEQNILILLAACREENSEVNKKNKEVKYKHLIELIATRFQMFLKHNEQGQLIIAANEKKLNPVFSKYYYKAKRHGAPLYTYGETINVELKRLTDYIYYSYERFNPFLQLSDFIVSSVAHDIKKKNSNWFNQLKPRFRQSRENIKGYGLLVYPRNDQIFNDLINPTS